MRPPVHWKDGKWWVCLSQVSGTGISKHLSVLDIEILWVAGSVCQARFFLHLNTQLSATPCVSHPLGSEIARTFPHLALVHIILSVGIDPQFHSKQEVRVPSPCANLDILCQAVNDWWEEKALSSQLTTVLSFRVFSPIFLVRSRKQALPPTWKSLLPVQSFPKACISFGAMHLFCSGHTDRIFNQLQTGQNSV